MLLNSVFKSGRVDISIKNKKTFLPFLVRKKDSMFFTCLKSSYESNNSHEITVLLGFCFLFFFLS